MPAPLAAAGVAAKQVASAATRKAAAKAGATAARLAGGATRGATRGAKEGLKAGVRGAAGGGKRAAGAAAKGTGRGARGSARAASQLPRSGGWAYQKPVRPNGAEQPAGTVQPPGAQGQGQRAAGRVDGGAMAREVAGRAARSGLRTLLGRRSRRAKTARGADKMEEKVKEIVRNRSRKLRRRLMVIGLFLFFLLPLTIGAFGTALANESAANQDQERLDVGQVSGIPYADIFNRTADLGIDPRLVAAVAWAESGFRDEIVDCVTASSAGALGIMQFMPGTAREMGVDPCDPAEAIPGGARYLLTQYETFGSWELALAAYNAGPGAVVGGEVPRNGETEIYVAKVLGQWETYKRQFPGGTLVSGPGGAPGGPLGSTERYTEPGLPAVTQRLVDAVVPLFGRGYGLHCFGQRSGPSDHPAGKACDFMFATGGARAQGADLAQGDALAAWLQSNATSLNITYIIWQNRIWSTGRAGEGWRVHHADERGGNTYLHYDHVHVSVR